MRFEFPICSTQFTVVYAALACAATNGAPEGLRIYIAYLSYAYDPCDPAHQHTPYR